jgi:hypothetical protein
VFGFFAFPRIVRWRQRRRPPSVPPVTTAHAARAIGGVRWALPRVTRFGCPRSPAHLAGLDLARVCSSAFWGLHRSRGTRYSSRGAELTCHRPPGSGDSRDCALLEPAIALIVSSSGVARACCTRGRCQKLGVIGVGIPKPWMARPSRAEHDVARRRPRTVAAPPPRGRAALSEQVHGSAQVVR